MRLSTAEESRREHKAQLPGADNLLQNLVVRDVLGDHTEDKLRTNFAAEILGRCSKRVNSGWLPRSQWFKLKRKCERDNMIFCSHVDPILPRNDPEMTAYRTPSRSRPQHYVRAAGVYDGMD